MTRVRIGLLLAAIPFAIQATTTSDVDAAPRFELRGTLETVEPALARGRFALRGQLVPAAGRHAQTLAGFSLKAVLAPNGGALCFGPGHVFRDGFEGGP